MRGDRGYTLLEVMVATVIMAVAVVALLSNLSTSLNNASRLTDYDRAVLVSERVMNDLLLNRRLPLLSVIEGEWDERAVGVAGGWRAQVTPFEAPPGGSPLGLQRIELEVYWMQGANRRTFLLDAYRQAQLTEREHAFLGASR